MIHAMSTIHPLGRGTLTDAVYERLGDLISSGQLVPGEKLVIDRLARQFDVSITPVREALRRLQHEGLVTETPYRGVIVSKASHEQLRELFAVRGLLEGYAAAEACRVMSAAEFAVTDGLLAALERATAAADVREFRRLNREFHDSFVHRAPSRALQAAIADIARNTERYRLADTCLDSAYLAAAQAEHRQLYTLLRKGRGEELERLHRRHAMTFVDHLIRGQETEPRAHHQG